MKKNECVKIFNEMVRGTPVSFHKLISLYSDYLTENNIEKSDKLINLVVNKPMLMQQAIPKIVDYFRRKYFILSITFNNKTILYYE